MDVYSKEKQREYCVSNLYHSNRRYNLQLKGCSPKHQRATPSLSKGVAIRSERLHPFYSALQIAVGKVKALNYLYSLLMLCTGFSLAMRQALRITRSTISTNKPTASRTNHTGEGSVLSANCSSQTPETYQAKPVPRITAP